jgi:hypothetical protein
VLYYSVTQLIEELTMNNYTVSQTTDELTDIRLITDAKLEVSINANGSVLWINLEGKCLVRICNIKGGISVDGPIPKSVEDTYE